MKPIEFKANQFHTHWHRKPKFEMTHSPISDDVWRNRGPWSVATKTYKIAGINKLIQACSCNIDEHGMTHLINEKGWNLWVAKGTKVEQIA